MYGCRAYAYITKKLRARKAELAERAHIGFLVGYDSTNIFRVWLPSKDYVIATRDVTFDESLRYDPRGQLLDDYIREHIEEIVDSFGIDETLDSVVPRHYHLLEPSTTTPSTPPMPPTFDSGKKEDEKNDNFSDNDMGDKDMGDKDIGVKENPLPPAPDNPYITPEGTPEPGTRPGAVQPRTKRAPSTSLLGIDPANILDSKMRTRRAAYLADVQDIEPLSGVHAAFSAAIQQRPPALHRDQLPPPPRHWKELLSHAF